MKRRYLNCSKCGAVADMKEPITCSGWIIAPKAICPTCVEKDVQRQDSERVRKQMDQRLAPVRA